MEGSISKAQALEMIATALEEAEEAIRSHPDETVAVYEQGSRALLEGMEGAEETNYSREVGLSLEELAMAHRYMAAMAFMSAWYAIHGNKAQRDKAAQSAALLVSGLGLDPEGAFTKVLEYERLWKQSLTSSGAVRGGCAGVIAVVCIPAALALLLA